MTDKFYRSYDVVPYIQHGETSTFNYNITSVDPHTAEETTKYDYLSGDYISFESGFHIGVDPAFDPIDRGKFLEREGYHNGEKYYERQTWATGYVTLSVGETVDCINQNDDGSNYIQVNVL